MIGKTLIDMIKTISTSSHNIKLISEIKNRNKAKQILAPVTEYLNQNYRRMASHQILSVYLYFFFNSSKNLFFFIDSFLFSKLQNNFNCSLQLAIIRLLCLVAYEIPHQKCSQEVRELFHVTEPTSTNYMFLMRLGIQRTNIIYPELQNFKKQVYSSFIKDIDNFDITQLIMIRKISSRIKKESSEYEKLIEVLDKKINNQTYRLNRFEIKNLANCYTINRNWFFNYVFKSYFSCWRKYGFYVILIENQLTWKEWAFTKYGEKEIIEQLPEGYSKENKHLELYEVNKFLYDYNLKGQYIDIHYEIQEKDGSYYIKNELYQISSYLEHAFNFIYSSYKMMKKQQIQKISLVLQNIPQDTQLSMNSLFKLFCLKFFFNYYFRESQSDNDQRNKKDVHRLLKRLRMTKQYFTQTQKYSISKIIRTMSSLSISQIQSQQFVQVYEFFIELSNKWVISLQNQKLPPFKTFMMAKDVVDVYLKGNAIGKKQEEDNQIIFGDFQSYTIEGCEDISVASDIEINETVFVDKLIKLKVKGENVSFFTDFIENIDEKKEMSEESYHYLMFRMKWKENYLRGWCGLNYHIFYSLQNLEQYIKQITK